MGADAGRTTRRSSTAGRRGGSVSVFAVVDFDKQFEEEDRPGDVLVDSYFDVKCEGVGFTTLCRQPERKRLDGDVDARGKY